MKTFLGIQPKVVKLNIDKQNQIPKIKTWTLAAIGVHLLTSFGIVCSLFAVLNVFEGNLGSAFMWLGVALFIDAIDGTLARKIDVATFTPNINGLMMDSIVDFTNYILIPCLILVKAGYLLPNFEVCLPAIILVVSLFSYSRISVSDDDFRYVGFPVAWNIVVVYLFILEMSQLANSVVVSIFIALKFVPLKYVHPFRTRRLRKPTLIFTGLWFLSTAVLCLNKAVTLDAYVFLMANGVLALATFYFLCLTLASGFESHSVMRQTASGVLNIKASSQKFS